MKKYVTLDLRKIASELGDHLDPGEADLITEQCPICRDDNTITWLEQDQDKCPVCGVSVVWKNSKLWQSIFGTANARIRSLTRIPATTTSGKHLMARCGLEGFDTKADADNWQRAVRMFGDGEMRRIVNYVTGKKTGRPALKHAMAIAAKKIREGKIVREEQEPQTHRDHPINLNIVTGKE